MAKYDLSKQIRKQQFIKRVKSLLDNKKFVDLKVINQRTLGMNAYMHLCFTAYAIYTGYTTNYVKQHIFKQLINPHIFVVDIPNTETGDMYQEIRSTADLTEEESHDCMFNFKEHCAQIDFRLPERDDLLYQREIMEAEAEQKLYLENNQTK